MAERADIAKVVAVISAAYPHFEPTSETVEVYWQTLGDVPGEVLLAATMQAVAEPDRKFAPSVGEIRGHVLKALHMIEQVPSSAQAWDEVRRNFIDVGHTGTPKWSHPLIESAVRVMGWRDMCMSENPVADRAHFLKVYEQLAERDDYQAMMLPAVRGFIEAHGKKQLAPASAMGLLADKLGGRKR